MQDVSDDSRVVLAVAPRTLGVGELVANLGGQAEAEPTVMDRVGDEVGVLAGQGEREARRVVVGLDRTASTRGLLRRRAPSRRAR
ncbi:hypothetical protein J2853_001874 [Streptosporangium lutulentum]|uniref:Uncharacterized protein n=1 Tax=Streptosporangium lutulentum TaxID=1461250 RepID=A0ABT9Q7E0_9ACTN|nr:hypothetical protein [Streptosporangium lutulentum]MDP9842663.1 hypothetical protein [Streptosporangium lutulentum]